MADRSVTRVTVHRVRPKRSNHESGDWADAEGSVMRRVAIVPGADPD